MILIKSINKEFVDEYGEELLERIFYNIYGDKKDEDIYISERRYLDVINSSGSGIFEIDGKEIWFEFEDGNWNGSCITYYGEEKPEYKKHYATIKRFVLDKERINKKELNLMRKKFKAMKNIIEEKEKNYNYDMYFEPTNKIKKYYYDWAYKNYLKIVTEYIETD